ncbi:MAG: hypothetical protein NVV74_23785 [Magnetospirillum sp.]|nr:hypothetical protein [Magnetospirillum sp.]
MIDTFARALADEVPGAMAVLFYGSCLRDPQAGGIPDLYVLTDAPRGLADRLLPPTVRFRDRGGIAAKVATMPAAAFVRAMDRKALATHLWARFCQPVALAWSRDPTAADAVRAALREAQRTAAWWAERLAPARSPAETAFETLFRHTYAAELRAERKDRPRQLVQAAPAHWRGLAQDWFSAPSAAERHAAARAWTLRRRLGKPLAALRLAKAAFTFEGGASYLVWKIERHTGYRLALTPWQRRHPLLAALPLLLRLRRAGIIR